MSLQIKFASTTSQGDPCQIQLIGGGVALVDQTDFEVLKKYVWRAIKSNKCTYALRLSVKDGKYHYIRMHREIAKTPEGQDCHHINHNPLDNRRRNLLNLWPEDHKGYHGHMFF